MTTLSPYAAYVAALESGFVDDAAVPLDALYVDGALAFPFRRTLSRLKEMQLARFEAAQ